MNTTLDQVQDIIRNINKELTRDYLDLIWYNGDVIDVELRSLGDGAFLEFVALGCHIDEAHCFFKGMYYGLQKEKQQS